MFPFQDIRNEFGQMRQVPWSAAKAQAKLREIRKGVNEELNARDCREAVAVGVGHMVHDGILPNNRPRELPHLQTCEIAAGVNGGGKYVINALAAQIKHSGAEAKDMVGKRWREFCSVAQPDDRIVAVADARAPKEPGVYDAKLHRYVYPKGSKPKVETAGVVDVAEDRKPTRRESFAPSKSKRVDRRTRAYKKSQRVLAAAKESDGGQLPDNDGTADPVS